MWAMKPGMVPLLPQLTQQDASQVNEYLTSRNEEFNVDPTTGLILVPADRLQKLQIELATLGLPQSQGMGLELLRQEQSLGTSQFIELARYQHAQETELSRTISSMRNVASARVHLAMPKRSVFVRNQDAASASVMVKMHSGRTLERGQVTAIVSLVSASVPYLDSGNVTVIDQWGRLLSSDDNGSIAQSSEKQFDYSRKLENHFAQRIEKLLTPLVGLGRVHATVSADVDFTLSEQTEEKFDADPDKIRSEQRQEMDDSSMEAGGIPGALTNQPPEDGAIQQADEEGKELEQSSTGSRKMTRNYELDKTISHIRNSTGKIARLSVAVIVDNMEIVNEAGETVTQAPTDEDLTQYATLVREAIGFDEERGDSVVVYNQPFQPIAPIEELPSAPIWEQAWVWSLARQVVIGLIALFLIMSVARPAYKTLKQQLALAQNPPRADTAKPENTESGASPEGEDKLLLSAEGQAMLGTSDGSYGDILLMAQAMARDDPKRVARVVKEWVSAPEDEK
ncbi:flagellar M-ring protein FliF [Chromatiales bacterium (ex Bugula neritina AB1)]|nr:flagellar M-ring protein FliF [Chromatiales bacterium (ex Bugula neritina AB1)]